MKQLLQFIPSYIKDSKALLDDLYRIKLSPDTKVFTANMMAMYTNIYIQIQA
jgi:uncharacterized protein YpmS